MTERLPQTISELNERRWKAAQQNARMKTEQIRQLRMQIERLEDCLSMANMHLSEHGLPNIDPNV